MDNIFCDPAWKIQEYSLFYSCFSSDIFLSIAICHPYLHLWERGIPRRHHRVAAGFVRACLPLSRIPDHCPSPSVAVYKVSSTFSSARVPPLPSLHPLCERTQNTAFESYHRKRAACETPPSDPLTRIGDIPREEAVYQEQASEYITDRTIRCFQLYNKIAALLRSSELQRNAEIVKMIKVLFRQDSVIEMNWKLSRINRCN